MVTAEQIAQAYRNAMERLDAAQQRAVRMDLDASSMVQFGDQVVDRRLEQQFRAEAARLNAAQLLGRNT